jgi:hypothetical protein
MLGQIRLPVGVIFDRLTCGQLRQLSRGSYWDDIGGLAEDLYNWSSVAENGTVRCPGMDLPTSATGQKRRILQSTAAPRLPLYAVSDQARAALQYVAMGQLRKSALRIAAR